MSASTAAAVAADAEVKTPLIPEPVATKCSKYRPATTRLSRLLYAHGYDPLEDEQARRARALLEFMENQYDAKHPPMSGLLITLKQYREIFVGIAFGIVGNQVLQSLADWLFPGEPQSQLLLWLGLFAIVTSVRFVAVQALTMVLDVSGSGQTPWARKVEKVFAQYTNVVTLVAFGVTASLLLQAFVNFMFPHSKANALLLSIGVFVLVLSLSLVFSCAASLIQNRIIDPFVERYERSHRSLQQFDNKTLASSA